MYLHLPRGVPGEVDLPVLGVDDVELRELELPLVAHGQGGVVPPVTDLGAGVGDWNVVKINISTFLTDTHRSQISGDRTASPLENLTTSSGIWLLLSACKESPSDNTMTDIILADLME